MPNILVHGRVCLPLILIAIVVGGCTPYATYPPVASGEVAVPWMHPLPDVMGKALGDTYRRTSDSFVSAGTPIEFVYGLPEGITVGVWTRVGVDTGIDDARMATADDLTSGTPIWVVEQVRIRNQRAEVDVIYPTPGGAYSRATVILETKPFGAYEIAFFQRWQTRVDDPVFSLPIDLPTDDGDEPGAEAEAEAVSPQVEVEVEVESESAVETDTEA